MKHQIESEEHHEILLIEGLKYLDDNLPGIQQKLFLFSAGICSKMVDILGKDKIAHEFSLKDYRDTDFVQQMSFRIEFGVPVFLIQNKLFNEIVNSDNILPVTTALNFSIANDIATIFNKIQLRNSETSCVYSNYALLQIVNRTMNRYYELSLSELNSFCDLF